MHVTTNDSFMCNGPKLETADMSFNRRMGKQVCPCYETPVSDKEKQTLDTYNNLNGSPEDYSEKSQYQMVTHCMIPFI